MAAWSLKQHRYALKLMLKGYDYAEIAPVVGRSADAVRKKLERGRRPPTDPPATRRPKPRRNLIDEWQRRLALRPRDLTAAICGDPLPGYSALDRRPNLS